MNDLERAEDHCGQIDGIDALNRSENEAMMLALRDALKATREERDHLLDANIAMRRALKPFSEYANQHGFIYLLGRNGASLSYDAWRKAVELTQP